MRFLIRVILIVLVAAVIGIVGLLMLPGDRIAQIAAAQIAKQTGRDVQISSDSSISLYPTLGITTGKAVIGSADWATEGPLFEADNLAIGIDVPALLTGTIRISKLEANAPRIILERSEDGRANWEVFPSEDSAAPELTEPAQDAENSYDFSLERAQIRAASLVYVDKSTGTSQQFDEVDLDVTWPDADSAAEITLGIAPFGERIDMQATVGGVLDIANGAQTPLQGTMRTGGASMTFAGTASIAPTLAMQIALDAPDAGQLLRAAGQSAEALGVPKDFAPDVAFAGNVSFDGSRAALRAINASVDGSVIEGDADIVLGQALQIAAKLALDIKNAGPLMRMAGQAPETFGLAANFDPAIATDLTLQLNGSDLSAELRNVTASLAGASYAGVADVSVTNGTPTATLKGKASAPNVAAIADVLGQPLANFGLASTARPSFSGDIDATLQGTSLNAAIANLNASMADAIAQGAVTINTSGTSLSASGKINAIIPSTAKLMSQLGQSPADIPQGFGKAITADTSLSYDGSTLSLSDMSVSLDQNRFAGRASLNLTGAKPKITAQLSASDLDFSSLGSSNTDTDAPSSPTWSKDPIDASALSLANADISLNAPSINLGTLQLGQTNLQAVLDNARVQVQINDLRAYHGALSGTLVANNRNGLSVSAKLGAQSVALQPLLTALAGINRISGNANVTVDVLGAGNTMHAIMNSLRGSLAMSVPEGTVSGVDFEGLLREGNANANLTRFSGLKASGPIKAGTFANNDLSVATGRMEVSGEGRVMLGSKSIDYIATPLARDVGDRSVVSFPVRIRGPWSDVSIYPDVERALELEAKREAEKLKEQARQELEREKEKLAERARAEAENAARQAAERAAEKLGLDAAKQKQLENAARQAIEDQVGQGLRNLLGGN